MLPSDSRIYHRGHVFGRGVEAGDNVTIGLSSASKIWSNRSSKLPEFIRWCAQLAARICSDRVPVTNSGLDYLDVGEEIEELPGRVIAVDWPANVYKSPATLRFATPQGDTQIQLLDVDFEIDPDRTTDDTVLMRLSYGTDFALRRRSPLRPIASSSQPRHRNPKRPWNGSGTPCR